MDIATVWNIVWQDTPFHWAIAIILVLFIIIEFSILWEYWHLKCCKTSKGIKFLEELQRGRTSQPPTDWLKKHFETEDANRLQAQYQRHQKFILKKYPTVLARPIPRSSLRFVTTLCTSIGVLGTFYGIQQGLQGLNLDIANSQQLMASSIELLKNMKTAFSTSLMGLGCGSLFTLVLFVTDSLRRRRRNGLRDKLDRLTTFENDSQKLIKEIKQLKQNFTNQNSLSAEAIGEAVGRSIAKEFTQLNQLTSEAIGKAVGKQIQSIIIPGISRIIEEQERIRELQENQGQRVLEQLIQDLRDEVIEPVARRLDESAELTRRASEAVTNLHNELGGISKSLASSIQTIQNFQQETLVELQNFANNLGQTLNQFQTDTKDVLKQTGIEINRAVEQSIAGMTAQREAFEESAGKASGLMDSAKEKLLDTLGTIDQTLTATRQTVQDDLTQFREQYQSNLQAFFKEQNNLLKGTLGEQRDGLAEVVTNLSNVFEDEYNRRNQLTQQVDESMNQVSTAATEVNKLVCAVGLNESNSLVQQEKIACELNQISRNLNQQVQGVEKKYEELSNAFKYSLDTWTNHFDKSQDKYFNEADNAMTKVCNSLLDTAKVLVAANNNRNNGNGSNYHE